jgi:hypothetical protein
MLTALFGVRDETVFIDGRPMRLTPRGHAVEAVLACAVGVAVLFAVGVLACL